ncbi:MAG: phosphate regulon sensor histidine kinase PhoR [Formosimonas sp.]
MMKPVSFWRDLSPILLMGAAAVVLSSFWEMAWLGWLLWVFLLLWRLSSHYRELNLFALWLSHPVSQNVPSGHGVWTEIFAKLYALRRTDELHEAQLAEWLERFQNTMRHLPDGVILMNRQSELEWANPVAEQHFQFTLAQDKNNRIVNLVRVPALVELIQQSVYDVPLKLSYFNRVLAITLINFEEQRVILVSRDITETEKVDAMRRDFIANASHELRTPLTVIAGFLEHAKEAADISFEQQQQQIDLMHRQAEHMTVLIQDMLMLSRLESDVVVEDEPVDMPALLAQQIHQAQALSNGELKIHAAIAPIHLQGSPAELLSVVSNLLTNAVRYTSAGGQIHVLWALRAGLPTLSVQDTGAGIANEHIPRLTERFYRVNKDQSRASKGTGLGLAIVKHVLLRHQATLSIESKLGEGSIFTVVFPTHRQLNEKPLD